MMQKQHSRLQTPKNNNNEGEETKNKHTKIFSQRDYYAFPAISVQ